MVKINRTKITAESGKHGFSITREFDAPRELVLRAYTNPELYVKWLGPRDLTMILEKFESKSGGARQYVHKDKNINNFAFHGVNHEVKNPYFSNFSEQARVIGTFEFEGFPQKGHVSLETVKFESLPDGGTKVISHAVFQPAESDDNLPDRKKKLNEAGEHPEELLEEMKK